MKSSGTQKLFWLGSTLDVNLKQLTSVFNFQLTAKMSFMFVFDSFNIISLFNELIILLDNHFNDFSS